MAKEKQVTKPSAAQEDLERRQADDYVPDAAVKTVTVNPNPFGNEAYAGVDPIYQNHANDTEKPLAAQDGPEKVAEENVKKLYSLDNVAKEDVVDDYGQGGKARRAASPVVEPNRFLVPGQEGYPDNAEQTVRPVVRAESAQSKQGKGDGEAEFPPAASVPVNPSAPNQQDSDASSDR